MMLNMNHTGGCGRAGGPAECMFLVAVVSFTAAVWSSVPGSATALNSASNSLSADTHHQHAATAQVFPSHHMQHIQSQSSGTGRARWGAMGTINVKSVVRPLIPYNSSVNCTSLFEVNFMLVKYA